MSNSAVCWKCGASLAQLSLPLLRHDACKACGAQLHVCKLCRFYDITVAKQCREPIAEIVIDKERANFCDYFELRLDAYVAPQAAADKARAELDALFGGAPRAANAVKSAEDAARAALENLFGNQRQDKNKM